MEETVKENDLDLNNRYLRIVFKFRDDLKVPQMLLNHIYFHDNTQTNYVDALNTFFKESLRVDSNKDDKFYLEFIKFYEELVELGIQDKIYYLFKYNKYELFNTLLGHLKEKKGGIDSFTNKIGNYFFPNFYNFFGIDITDTVKNKEDKDTQKKITDYLEFFGKYMPENNDNYIIEIAYLKSNSIKASSSDISTTNGEKLFDNLSKSIKKEMMPFIPNRQRLFLKKSFNDVKLSIFEVYGWKLDENTVGGFDINTPMLFPQSIQNSDSGVWKNNHINNTDGVKKLEIPKFYQHGNKTIATIYNKLGVSEIKYQLCSATLWEHYEVQFEENAFLECINHSNFFEGDIILLEIQINLWSSVINKSNVKELYSVPIGVEPAMYELMCLAHALDIIVIEPASNNGDKDIEPFMYNENRPHFLYSGINNKEKFMRKDFEKAYNKAISNEIVKLPKANIQKLSKIAIENYQKLANNLSYSNFEIRPSILVGSVNDNKTHFNETAFDSSGKYLKVFYYQGIKLNNDAYTHTSCSSAIIAGIAAALQTYAKSHGKYITPEHMFHLLSDKKNGDVATRGNVKIGVIPDFKKLIKKIDSTKEIMKECKEV